MRAASRSPAVACAYVPQHAACASVAPRAASPTTAPARTSPLPDVPRPACPPSTVHRRPSGAATLPAKLTVASYACAMRAATSDGCRSSSVGVQQSLRLARVRGEHGPAADAVTRRPQSPSTPSAKASSTNTASSAAARTTRSSSFRGRFRVVEPGADEQRVGTRRDLVQRVVRSVGVQLRQSRHTAPPAGLRRPPAAVDRATARLEDARADAQRREPGELHGSGRGRAAARDQHPAPALLVPARLRQRPLAQRRGGEHLAVRMAIHGPLPARPLRPLRRAGPDGSGR